MAVAHLRTQAGAMLHTVLDGRHELSAAKCQCQKQRPKSCFYPDILDIEHKLARPLLGGFLQPC